MVSQQLQKAALTGFQIAAKEITRSLDMADKINQTTDQLMDALQFIEDQFHLGLTFGRTDELYDTYIGLSTYIASVKYAGIAGLYIKGEGDEVLIEMVGTDKGSSPTSPTRILTRYKNTEEDIAGIIQRVAKKAAIDNQILNTKSAKGIKPAL